MKLFVSFTLFILAIANLYSLTLQRHEQYTTTTKKVVPTLCQHNKKYFSSVLKVVEAYFMQCTYDTIQNDKQVCDFLSQNISNHINALTQQKLEQYTFTTKSVLPILYQKTFFKCLGGR
ncbi:hypothetical protein ABPG74_010337 [Tetrahymena malaccensis]